MRYFGMVAIALACAFFGWYSAQKLNDRAALIDDFVQSLRRLKVEIGFSATPLEAAARRISKGAGSLEEFWKEFADALRAGSDAERAWEWAMNGLSIAPRQAEILGAFASGLGRSDRASQCERIDAAIESLKAESEILRAEAREKGKVRKTVGALAGAAIIILLI